MSLTPFPTSSNQPPWIRRLPFGLHIALPLLLRMTRRRLEAVGRFMLFSWGSLARCVLRPARPRLTLVQCWRLGIEAMPLAMLTAIFVGMVMVLQAGSQLMVFNMTPYAAGVGSKGLAEVMLPIFTGLVVGARAAASIAAELGTMRVTEQIDALEVLDVDPRRYLISSRLTACIIMLPLVTVYVDLVGLISGCVIGVWGLNLTAYQYFHYTQTYLQMNELVSGLIKTVFYGATMGICGCYFGYHARGGAEGVGRATTMAVVFTLILIILQEYLLSSWTLHLFGKVLVPSIGELH